MKIYDMYKQMEGKTVFFDQGWAHPTIVDAVGNSSPISLVIENGYAKYNGIPLRLTKSSWLSIYLKFLENSKSSKERRVGSRSRI